MEKMARRRGETRKKRKKDDDESESVPQKVYHQWEYASILLFFEHFFKELNLNHLKWDPCVLLEALQEDTTASLSAGEGNGKKEENSSLDEHSSLETPSQSQQDGTPEKREGEVTGSTQRGTDNPEDGMPLPPPGEEDQEEGEEEENGEGEEENGEEEEEKEEEVALTPGMKLLEDLHIGLLKNIAHNKAAVKPTSWQRLLDNKLTLWGETTSLKGRNYHSLAPSEKTRILKSLCDAQFDNCRALLGAIHKFEQVNDFSVLRPSPVGVDQKGRRYWHFKGARLYREKPPGINAKRHAITSSGSCKVVCSTIEELEDYAYSIGRSRQKDDKKLSSAIEKTILPPLIEKARKEKQVAQRLERSAKAGIDVGNVLSGSDGRSRRARKQVSYLYDDKELDVLIKEYNNEGVQTSKKRKHMSLTEKKDENTNMDDEDEDEYEDVDDDDDGDDDDKSEEDRQRELEDTNKAKRRKETPQPTRRSTRLGGRT